MPQKYKHKQNSTAHCCGCAPPATGLNVSYVNVLMYLSTTVFTFGKYQYSET